MPSTSFDSHVQITVQKTDLVVLDELILAATTSEAYETISAGTPQRSVYVSQNADLFEDSSFNRSWYA